MGNNLIYNQYKQSMLDYYKRMQKDGYKGNPAYTPKIEKDDNYLQISIKSNSNPDRLDKQGVMMKYDKRTKDISFFIGDFNARFNEETGQELVPEEMIVHYHEDGTMDVNHRSENNLSSWEKEELTDIRERRQKALVPYAERESADSLNELFNMSEILDSMDMKSFDYFEKLFEGFKYQVPEMNIEAKKDKDNSKNKEDDDRDL